VVGNSEVTRGADFRTTADPSTPLRSGRDDSALEGRKIVGDLGVVGEWSPTRPYDVCSPMGTIIIHFFRSGVT